jgi:hypothetical protein
MKNTVKFMGKAGLAVVTGVWPYGRYGWVVAVGAFIIIVGGIAHLIAR